MAETTLGNSTVNRTVTEYLQLVKPAGSDPVDVQDFNDNFDKIDDAWKVLSDSIPEHIPSQEEIDQMETDIARNTSNIATNTSNISSLTSTVNSQGSRITSLEQKPMIKDVLLTNLTDGDALVYDASQQKWVNGEGQAGIGLVIDNGLLCCQYEG